MFGDANIAIFAGRGGKAFAERMCSYMGRPLGESEVIRFSEGTSFVRFQKSVRDRDVYLVQPMALSPNDQFVEIAVLAGCVQAFECGIGNGHNAIFCLCKGR